MKLLFSLSFLVAITTGTLAQGPTQESCQLSSVVLVDGHGDEWPMKWLEDDDKKFFYNVCTDESNIYIRLRIKEELIRRKMALFGLTVWLDPNGKKKKRLGLHFPTGTEAKEIMEAVRHSGDHSNMTASQRADFQKQMEKSLIENLEILELIGLSDDPLTSTRSGITNGIKVAIAQDDEGAYVYEAIIPFKSYRLSKSSISALGVGFETGKYTLPSTKPKAGSSTADPTTPGQSGFGGGFGATNMGRGQGYQGSASGSQMSYATSFWVSINLKK